MLKVQEIRELIKLVDQSSIDEFVYENEGSKIKMKKNVATTVSTVHHAGYTETQGVPVVQNVPVQAPAPVVHVQETQREANKETVVQADNTDLHKITSPMVGTFYASQSPDSDVYVK